MITMPKKFAFLTLKKTRCDVKCYDKSEVSYLTEAG